jgi:Uma2 family endonuclease
VTISSRHPISSDPDAAVPPVPVLRFSVQQYHEMGRAGILTPASRVELLEGWLVPKMMKKPGHRIATEAVRRSLEKSLPLGWHVNSQEPITLSASEPEPDVTVIRGELRDYRDRHPGPADVALVVEVADSSLEDDRTLKKQIYARDGIQVYWIVNLVNNCLERYGEPSGPMDEPNYRQRDAFALEDEVPVILEGREVGRLRVRDLLP